MEEDLSVRVTYLSHSCFEVQDVDHTLLLDPFFSKENPNAQTILAIEKGKYVPSLDLAFRISHHFKVNIEEIFTYEDEVRTVDID